MAEKESKKRKAGDGAKETETVGQQLDSLMGKIKALVSTFIDMLEKEFPDLTLDQLVDIRDFGKELQIWSSSITTTVDPNL